MVDWQNPVNVALEFFGVVKLVHFVLGIVTWELLSTFYFDWQVVTRRRVFKWPFLLYTGCRFCILIFSICASVGFSIPTFFNCQVWIFFVFGPAYVGIGLASALLTLRTVAFWNKNRIVIPVAFSLWLLQVAFLIYGVIQGRSEWDSVTSTCIATNTERNLQNILVTFLTDLGLLTIMLSKLWGKRRAGALWTLVYHQGIFWVAGAVFGELPGIVLIWLNYNDAMNLLLQPVTTLFVTFCATKMYRDLCEYAKPLSAQELSIDISPLKPATDMPKPPARPTILGGGSGVWNTSVDQHVEGYYRTILGTDV